MDNKKVKRLHEADVLMLDEISMMDCRRNTHNYQAQVSSKWHEWVSCFSFDGRTWTFGTAFARSALLWIITKDHRHTGQIVLGTCMFCSSETTSPQTKENATAACLTVLLGHRSP